MKNKTKQNKTTKQNKKPRKVHVDLKLYFLL